ncbi:MAG TPA: tetratricopeptide repeat protein [Terriglobia bacterium]|nr:tetratricopeptide repeat protein [Terriglobia bacterium]
MRQHRWLASIVVLTVLVSVIYFLHLRSATTPSVQAPENNVTRNSYVDPTLCADCHPNISETYQHTGMGRSFSRPTTANTVGEPKNAVTFYHKPSDSYFTMMERDGRFYQRRYQIGFDGKETNSLEKQIDFVMGSGNHVRAYLHRTSRNTLVELPLAWYAEKGGSWAMNPGYDRPDHPGFTRAVTYGCMFCHNGIPEIRPGDAQSGAEPVFSGNVPQGIDCQRCHGPGGKHVETVQAAAGVEEIRKAIVNPARLSPDRQMEVCMQCHLETTSSRLPNSIVRYDRDPFSYKPGELLADFMLHFDQAPGAGNDDKFEIAGAAYRLRRSACFQKSEGALQCTTCHNPHDIPRGEPAAAHYTAVCRQCHDAGIKKLVASGKHSAAGDCIGCHMPRRRTDDVVHVVMTDHYIQRRKPARDLLAPITERRETDENAYHGEVVLYYPETLPEGADRELYLAIAQVSQKANLSEGTQQLATAVEKYRPDRTEFYLHLADAWKNSGQMDKAIPLYEEAVRRRPDSLIALQRLGFSLRSSGQLARAAEILKRALAVDARDAATWHQLGLVYLGGGSTSDGLAAFQKAVELDPDMSEARNSLGGVWLESGDLPQAESAFREALRIQPDYAEAHSNLGSVLASAGRFGEARYEFETAIRLKPDYAEAQFNYGIALARSGDLSGALSHLRKAAESPDPSMRERALQVLQRLGQN